MTHSGRWLAFFGLAGLVLGTVRGQAVLSLLSLCVLLWILFEWLRFQFRIRFELPKIRFERTVNGRSDPSGVLWATRNIHVSIRLQSESSFGPILTVRDVVPENIELLPTSMVVPIAKSVDEVPSHTSTSQRDSSQRGTSRRDFVGREGLEGVYQWCINQFNRLYNPQMNGSSLNQWRVESRASALEFFYEARVRAAGKLILPGLRITMEDMHGLFQHARFIDCKQNFRVLPGFSNMGELRPTIKRQNSLPQHGVHRLQRSGMGSELLELREYVEGDPPKSIAWKASARRDKLMTRQYESEVPVRLQLFIDGSIQTRVGGYGYRLIDQISYVAASVAHAAITNGDPVGGMLIDERGTQRLPSHSGQRGFHQFMQALSDFSVMPTLAPRGLTTRLIQQAMQVCNERFPELLDGRFNQRPFSFFASNRTRYQLAGLLSEVFGLSVREQLELMHNDAAMALRIQELLSEAGYSWMEPLPYSSAADETYEGGLRMMFLGEAISRAVLHAKDNEVFVLLADLLECAPHFSVLAPSLKLAIARHHRVAFVCPTPTFKRPIATMIYPKSERVHDLLFAAEETRVRDLAIPLKRELMKLGISVAFSGEQNAIQLILDEIDVARSGRRRLQGVRT